MIKRIFEKIIDAIFSKNPHFTLFPDTDYQKHVKEIESFYSQKWSEFGK